MRECEDESKTCQRNDVARVCSDGRTRESCKAKSRAAKRDSQAGGSATRAKQGTVEVELSPISDTMRRQRESVSGIRELLEKIINQLAI